MAQMQAGGGKQPVLVWDVAVRVFHWALVLLIGFSWLSAEMDWMDWHFYSGYAVLTLILFRILWGFAGSTHARFGDFLYGPSAIIAYLRTLPSRTAAKFAGHNPLGGISVLLILLCVLLQAGTGMFANDDILYEGPLYKHVSKDLSDLLTTIHKYNFNALLVLAGAHIAAVLYYLLWKSENLVKPMFTGRKQLPPGVAPAHARVRGAGLAVLLLAVCAAAVWFLVRS
ncbi:MAG: cytochrome b/b6 domain-containing protein [Burkholderiales bacterium]|nr:cytochrome b/b6 domain-containing protein [Burkholderiales bacterium]MCW5604359.1 cytochrome b/b6 domain-containing protein [Burkholderiales bacterium]